MVLERKYEIELKDNSEQSFIVEFVVVEGTTMIRIKNEITKMVIHFSEIERLDREYLQYFLEIINNQTSKNIIKIFYNNKQKAYIKILKYFIENIYLCWNYINNNINTMTEEEYKKEVLCGKVLFKTKK